MRYISLGTLTVSGFKSFRQKQTIKLSPDAGLKFVCGRNLADKRMGANGAGKSSVWDAIHWCFYGTSVRGRRASDLLSWGSEQIQVEVLIYANDSRFVLARNSNPERLYLDGDAASQADFNEVLGLSAAASRQSVIFGQATPLFFDLSVPARGELLDEVLTLDRWMGYSDDAGKLASTLDHEIAEAERTISRVQGRRESLPNEQEIQRQSEDWSAEYSRRIADLADNMDELEKDETHWTRRVKELREELELIRPDLAEKELQASRRDLTTVSVVVAQFEKRLRDIDRAVRFYDEHDTCPTCGQDINKVFIDNKVAAYTKERKATETEINKTRRQLAERDTAISKTEKHIAELHSMRGELNQAQRVLDTITEGITRLEEQGNELVKLRKRNPYVEQLAQLREDRAAIQKELRTLVGTMGRLGARHSRVSYWKQGFRRVRLYRMRRALAHLELETANEAAALGLGNWKIRFRTEVETKSGTMRPGVHIQIDAGDDKGREWSPGELQRVRLAVNLGLAHLIQQLAGVVYTWEVFDEPSNWLSPEGIGDLLEQLKYRADATDRSIWLVDHRALIYGGFSETWEVVKTTEGSTVQCLQKGM